MLFRSPTKTMVSLTAPSSKTEFDENTLRSEVAQYNAGMPLSQIVKGWGKEATTHMNAIKEMGMKLAKDQGETPEQYGQRVANAQVDFAAGKKSVSQLNTMLGATRQAISQLDFNIDKTSELLQKNKGLSDVSPVINAIARGYDRWTGDPKYAQLFYYMHATAMESARLLQSGQGSVAQLHQGAAEEAKKWADAGWTTPKQFLEGVGPAMKTEGRFRIKSYEDAIEKQRVGGGMSAQQMAPIPSGIPSGSRKIGTTPDGKPVYQSPDGKKWVE